MGFYTIQTESEKTFYLIIDRTGESETVYFLTEIDENDLLNVTEKQSETLPKNSAALESAIPTGNEELLNKEESSTEIVPETENSTAEDSVVEDETEIAVPQDNSMVVYIVLGVVCVIAIGVGYYLKVYKKKGENFEEDEEEENEGWTDDAVDDEESDSFLETEEE